MIEQNSTLLIGPNLNNPFTLIEEFHEVYQGILCNTAKALEILQFKCVRKQSMSTTRTRRLAILTKLLLLLLGYLNDRIIHARYIR